MTISTTLTIKNSSGCLIDDRGTPDYKDGQLSGSAPATSIADGASTSFKIEQKNSVSPGPEGTVTYSLETGNEKVPLSFYWDFASGPVHEEHYTATSGSSCTTVDVVQTDSSGDHHAATYTVQFHPRAPNEWDLVWALSVGLINKQLHALFYYKHQLSAPGFTQKIGSDGWSQLAVSAMADPTVAVPNNQTTQLDVHLPLTTATLQYMEGGAQKTQSLSGTTVIVTLDLSQAQVTDPTQLFAKQDAKDHVQALMSAHYSVFRLFIDLTQPALFHSLRVVNTASGAAVVLSQAAQSALQSGLAGVGHMDVAYPVQASGNPASIVPTLVRERTTQYSANGNYSSVNMCMMSRGRAEPNWASRFAFNAPLAATTNPDGTPAEAKARMLLSQDTLGEGYLHPTVLPAILQATTIPGSIRRLAPLIYQCSGARSNSNKNDGRGEWFEVNNGLDQYVLGTESVAFTTQPNTSQTDRCTVALNGAFQLDIEVSQYPLGLKDKLGTARYQQPWTGLITVKAGNDGKLVTTVDITLGQAPEPDVDKTIDGWVFNALDALFNWTTTTPQAGILDKAQKFATNLANTFRNNASTQLDVSDCVVLPMGGAYDYSQFIFNKDGAVQVDVSFPG
ncbi:MAG: hypothetical protein EOO71_03785 [Myxococcaceae bacterium]|nr:MAG: hypothetical protein EOO71_03785 [Myxococcaceae bacterium]